MTAVNASDLQDLMRWLSDGGRSARTAAEFFGKTCERLVAAGVPLWRVDVLVRSVFDRSFIWRLGEDVRVNIADFDSPDSAQFIHSPLATVFREAREVRYRPDDPDGDQRAMVKSGRWKNAVQGYLAAGAFADATTGGKWQRRNRKNRTSIPPDL